MALSEQEQRMLREIEQSLLAEDPKFSATVKNFGNEAKTGGVTIRGIALFMLGLVLLVGGVALSQQNTWFVAISVGGFLLMFGAAMWMLKRPRQAVVPQATVKQPSEGIAYRMEDNFRRRFGEN